MEEGKKRGTKKERKFGLKEFPRPFTVRNGGKRSIPGKYPEDHEKTFDPRVP